MSIESCQAPKPLVGMSSPVIPGICTPSFLKCSAQLQTYSSRATGTGRRRVAEAIHLASARAKGNLFASTVLRFRMHCLKASYLGYEKGAFTGAYTSFRGRYRKPMVELFSG